MKKPVESVSDRAIPDNGASEIMRLDEACQYIGVARPTMYAYLKRGIIRGLKPPGSRLWRFRKADLDAWLNKGEGDSQ